MADFELIDGDGNVEVAHARVYPLEPVLCATVFVTHRQEGTDDASWERSKTAIGASLERVKESIERHADRRSTSPTDHEDVSDRGEASQTPVSTRRAPKSERDDAPARYPYEVHEIHEAMDELSGSKKDGEPHFPTFARSMLAHLQEVGLLHTADAQAPENVRLAKLEQDQMVWVRLDTYRDHRYGYKVVEVVRPPRSEAAILAAMVAWGLDRKDFDWVLGQLAAGLAYGNFKVNGVSATMAATWHPKVIRAYSQKLKNIAEKKETVPEAWQPLLKSISGFQDDDERDQLAYMLHLLRYYRPGFDKRCLQEQLDLLKKAHGYIQDFLESLRTLQNFFGFGAPNRKLTPDVRQPEQVVQAAVLCDVHGLNHQEIGKALGVPRPEISKKKGGHVTVKAMVTRGRRILTAALGEEGWARRIEDMRADMAWWRTLSQDERYREIDAVIEARIFGVSFDEARRRLKLRDS